jgi:hypothetical protein
VLRRGELDWPAMQPLNHRVSRRTRRCRPTSGAAWFRADCKVILAPIAAERQNR